jgi:hypothetical protein
MRAATRPNCSRPPAPPAIRAPVAWAGRSARLRWRISCASTTRPAASKRPCWPAMWPHLPMSGRQAHRPHRLRGVNKRHTTVKTKGCRAGGGRRPRRAGPVSQPARRRGAGRPAKMAGSRSKRPPRRRPLRSARATRALRKSGRGGRVHRRKLPRHGGRRPRRLRPHRRAASRSRPMGRLRRYPVPSRRALPPRGPTTSPIEAIFSARVFPRLPPPWHPCRDAPRQLRARKMLRLRRQLPLARFPRDARSRPRRAQAVWLPRHCAPP